MKRKESGVKMWGVLFALLGLLVIGCSPEGQKDSPLEDLSTLCAGIITRSPEGHYLLNRSAIGVEDADGVNACIEAAGIKNVKVVRNLSDTLPAVRRS